MDTLKQAETIAGLLANVPGVTALVPFANPIPTLRIECADDLTARKLSQELTTAFGDLSVVHDPSDSRII